MAQSGNGANHIQSDTERRKRLGQYFTGDRLARLLVAIARGSQCRSAIDPMCGSGDMLAAVVNVAPQAKLAGIEIDQAAYDLCSSRLGDAANPLHLIHGNAFSWSTISRLPSASYDLVITNPPYVRYQSLTANGQVQFEGLPQAESVRQGVIEVAKNLPGLEDKDREIFVSVASGYSGLSDLAVPSWILCAMLTAIGGRLAMVVPEAWLNRDYAHPIHYLLLKLFRILWVVEDAHRAWFADAQVKTTLLVAERSHRADDIQIACAGQKYVQVSLTAPSITGRSIVGGIFPSETDPDGAFADALARLSVETGVVGGLASLPTTRRSLESKLIDLLATSRNAGWLRRCEPELTESLSGHLTITNAGIKIPQTLLDLLPSQGRASFTTLEALGVHVGQGLRTGANEFFYCELISEAGNECLVSPGKALKSPPVLVPKKALRPVLRKQHELPNGYVLVSSQLKGRVLLLDKFIHPDDAPTVKQVRGSSPAQSSNRIVMPPALAHLVTTASLTNLGTKDRPKLIPEMSAVRTNETKIKDGSIKTRHWYMLPPLAKRHVPDLLVARVNYLHPRFLMNSEERTIIDANFSTIWLEEGAGIDAYALLAYLNSSWAAAAMELTAAVMGGGALKLEATHLRRLPIPLLSGEQWHKLSALGKKLASNTSTSEILAEINQRVATAIFGEKQSAHALDEIERVKKEKLEARKQK